MADASSRNQRENIVQINFFVEIDGVVSASFMAVEGLESATEAIEFHEGIWSKSVRKIPGRTSYSNITLKRIYMFSPELWKWRKKVADGNVERRNGRIIITGGIGEKTVRFEFQDAWPVRWKLSTLEDRRNMRLVEELEIAIENLEMSLTRR
jgi:phage tail-like protein